MAGGLSDAQRGSGLGCLLGGRGVVAEDVAFDLVSEGRIVRVRGQRDRLYGFRRSCILTSRLTGRFVGEGSGRLVGERLGETVSATDLLDLILRMGRLCERFPLSKRRHPELQVRGSHETSGRQRIRDWEDVGMWLEEEGVAGRMRRYGHLHIVVMGWRGVAKKR